MRQFLGRVRGWWRVLARSRRLDADMADEMRLHVELETERLRRDQRLSPAEARRQALIRFGGVESFKEAGRDARGRQWLDACWLDARLAVRVLIKYRGLSIVGGFAMAVAIAIGAVSIELLREMVTDSLPFAGGDRIVAIQRAAANPGSIARASIDEVLLRADRVHSIERLGAYRTVRHNLISSSGPPASVPVAEISASGFALAGVPPLHGRYLLPDDELPSAPPVVVVGHTEWQTRFGADPTLVGRPLTFGRTAYTVVGVMPAEFAFPVDHQWWMPLRVPRSSPVDSRSAALMIFGRLTPDATRESASLELTSLARAVEGPDAAPVIVVPFTFAHVDVADASLLALVVGQTLTMALVVVVGINLAILVYARTTARAGEIAVRSALGASRRRILTQLFVESLALSVCGALVGLAIAGVALGAMAALVRSFDGIPFWIRFDLSAATVLQALALAVVAALITGVIPGLRATRRALRTSMVELNASRGARLGPLWTSLVVLQVAAAVAVLPAAGYLPWQLLRMHVDGVGFTVEHFAVITVDRPAPSSETAAAPDRVSLERLMTALAGEPAVDAVTFSSSVPGFAAGASIEFETAPGVGGTVDADEGLSVSRIATAVDLHAVYGARVLAGRLFTSADGGRTDVAIINETLAASAAGGGSVLGARFRYIRRSDGPVTPGRWIQVVGVIKDFPDFPEALHVDTPAVVYQPAALDDMDPVTVSVRFRAAAPAGLDRRIRQLAAAVDPTLQIRQVQRLEDYYGSIMSVWGYLSTALGLMTLSVLLLSAAGIYALTSFIVGQRRREIGIRAALGAPPRRLILSVFSRVIAQLAAGIAAGSLCSAALASAAGFPAALITALIVGVGGVMAFVAVLAATGPARRGLAINTAEVLRTDG